MGITSEVRAVGTKAGPITVEQMKQLLGWEVAESGDFLFRDKDGNKIRLKNNKTNRPFRMNLADRYANEMLRNKWKLNGESIVVDDKNNIIIGQHRGVGLIFAEQMRLADPDQWTQYGTKSEMTLETILVKGVSSKKDVADTADLGQKRSLGDVLFRNHEFKGDRKEQQKLANAYAVAIRLCWIRLGGKQVSDAPHFPHSEALDFTKANPMLKDACEIICELDGGGGAEGKKISSLVSLGYAAGLLYLMGTAKTNRNKVAEEGSKAISTTLWSKAKKFWSAFASGANLSAGDPVLILRNLLVKVETGSGQGRDELVGMIVKAWNLWVDGAKAEPKDIRLKKTTDDNGRKILAEFPRIGGLDVTVEIPEEEEVKEEVEEVEEASTKRGKKGSRPTSTNAGKKKGKTPRKNEWVWVAVEGEDEEPWKAQVVSVNGDSTTVKADESGDEYTVPTSDVYIDKPDMP